MVVNMHEAKTHLSRLVERVAEGEEVIIAKAGKAVAVLKPYQTQKEKRTPGVLKGAPLDLSRFDEADKEIGKLFGTDE